MNKLTAIDLFAGAGGLSLGLQNTNMFKIVAYNEYNKKGLETYRFNLNKGKTKIEWDGDIRKYTKDFRRVKNDLELKGIKEIDLISGGPPCQGFSMIGGRRNKAYLKKRDPVIFLYEEMVSFVRELQPRAFLFENVQGLVYDKGISGEKGEYLKDIIQEFKYAGRGYEIDINLVRAYEAGVPQNRPRIIMIGIRNDLKLNIEISEEAIRLKEKIENNEIIAYEDLNNNASRKFIPKIGQMMDKKKIPTVIEAIGDLMKATHESGDGSYCEKANNWYRKKMRENDKETFKNHRIAKHRDTTLTRFEAILNEHNGKIPENLAHEKKFSQRVLPKIWPNGGIPNITITSMPDDYIHYQRPSSLSVRECARLQSFPDWFEFKGNRTTGGKRRAGDPTSQDYHRDLPQYTQVGNAVPPLLAEYIGKRLAELIFDTKKSKV